MRCANHPNVETELTCGRCEKPICLRCVIQTPVGGRCRQCAGIRRLPTYHISPLYLARGAGTALAAGAAAGAAWWLVLPYRAGIFFGVLIALALGYAVGEAVSRATNRKSGPPLQALAAGGVILAYLVRNLLEGAPLLPRDDPVGYVILVLAALVALGRLR